MDVEHKVISTITHTKGVEWETEIRIRCCERGLQLIERGNERFIDEEWLKR